MSINKKTHKQILSCIKKEKEKTQIHMHIENHKAKLYYVMDFNYFFSGYVALLFKSNKQKIISIFLIIGEGMCCDKKRKKKRIRINMISGMV